MSKTDADDAEHRRPHTVPMAGPFLEFDLTREMHLLHEEVTWQTGQNARTLVKFDDLRVVLTALKANARMPEHKTEGRVSIHVLSGHLQIRASGRTFDLRAGNLLTLDRATPHDVEALEDSGFLITITLPSRGQQ